MKKKYKSLSSIADGAEHTAGQENAELYADDGGDNGGRYIDRINCKQRKPHRLFLLINGHRSRSSLD